MRWTELEAQARRLVDQLRRELRDSDLVTLERSEAADMAAQLLDGAALRELREDDPTFVREVVHEDGLEKLREERGEAAFQEALRTAILERMSGAMFVRLLETRGTARSRGTRNGWTTPSAPTP